MMQEGQKLPDATLTAPSGDGPQPHEVAALFAGKKAVLFGVPGAFTPTCHANHMSSFVAQADAIKAKGVDFIACVAVNDVFVMDAWSKASGAEGKVMVLADGSADFTKAAGMELDLTGHGLGLRSKRYAAIVEDGVVTTLIVEDNPGKAEQSGADGVLAAL